MRILKTNKLLQKNRIAILLCSALMLIMGAFLITGTTAYAATDDPVSEILSVITETLSVDDVWLVGERLNIVVTDRITGINQILELNLRDYASVGDEFVTIQAVDRAGNISNSIQFRNPFYVAPAKPQQPDPGTSEPNPPTGSNPTSNGRPFTPDGTGTVVDNVTDGDGKEFFSISTEDGNIFYLIVDRERNVDNVYLLNAVTEQDLMSLAKEGDGRPVSTVPEPPTFAPTTPEPPVTPEPTPEPTAKSGGDNGTLIFIIIAVVAVGGAGYYFKIVRPKQNGGGYEDDESEEFDDDTETDLEEDGEDGDEE